MFRKIYSRVMSVAIVGAMAMAVCTGCGSKVDETVDIDLEEVPLTDTVDVAFDDDLAVESTDEIYYDANGWSLRYDPNVIAVNAGGPMSTFVYTGDCAGTCMMTSTYDVGMDAETAAEELAKSWGEEAKVTECIFPGTADVSGYYVYLPPMEGGLGLVQDAFVRDYMDGYLTLEFTIHNCGDDSIDIPVSDAFAYMVDTLQF